MFFVYDLYIARISLRKGLPIMSAYFFAGDNKFTYKDKHIVKTFIQYIINKLYY